MLRYPFVLSLLAVFLPATTAFVHQNPNRKTTAFNSGIEKRSAPRAKANNDEDDSSASLSYEETDASSKRLVSSLTGIVNFFSFADPKEKTDATAVNYNDDNPPPKTPEELLERIRDDYVVRNYLWTGKIDLAAFDRQCEFTDPTLSFVGTDQFTKNLDNLVPIVNALTEPGGCKSDLLSIDLDRDKGYVQCRWNMVGSFSTLPWNPKIDVIGRTKFWYKPIDGAGEPDGLQVYFYDEEWEIPAGKALLQLITPPGTIRNTNLQEA